MQKINYQEYLTKATEHKHVAKSGLVSCSSLPYLEKCSAFVNRKSENNEASVKGTTLHYILDDNIQYLIHDDYELEGFPEFEEKKLRFIASQLQSMAAEGWRVFDTEAWFEDQDLGICGTVDLILRHVATGDYAILDYKTGLKHISPETAQLVGYGILFMKAIGDIRGLFCGVIQNDNEVSAVEVTFDNARLRLSEIMNGNHVTVNENCQYCQRLPRCQEFRKAEKTFLDGGFNLVESRDLVPALESKIDEIKKIVTEKLKSGEEVEGYVLSKRTTKSVNPMAYSMIIEQVGITALIQKEALKISHCDLIPAMFITENVTEYARKGKKK